ncbi:MAG TPA: nucleotidyltransferase domain-containing protein [Anaerolineae bacterium]|nr:nucleotidyltransferase domain-containing protein [Anaerolineae bacterium]
MNRLEGIERGQLLEQLQLILPRAISDAPIALAYLYGSAAQGRTTPLSDIDLAVVARDPSALTRSFELETKLAVELARHGLAGVDVRLINHAPIMLKGAAITEGILVYSADEHFRVEFETFTRQQYFDYLPVARRMQDDYIRAVLSRPSRSARVAG